MFDVQRPLVMTSNDAHQVIDACLAIFSHEVRSPLSTILGWSQIIATQQLKADRLHLACRAIERSAHEITALVSEVGYLRSCVGAGGERGAISLTASDILSLALEEVRQFAQERKVSVVVVDSTEKAELTLSDKLIGVQIIASLIAHAIRVAQAGGEVTVGAVLQGDFLKVSVEAARCEEGLHLAIARYLTELCGAGLSLEERGYGKPSLLVTTIPVRGASHADVLKSAEG